MEYNIYCDESCHLPNDKQKAMAIGAIWCEKDKKESIFKRLRELKKEHGLDSKFELKWNKVSPAKLKYYLDVINYFFDNSDLHFRVLIVPDKNEIDHTKFNQNHDEFYYKMYFNMLKAIISPNIYYNIYLDIKDTQGNNKIKKLHECLSNNRYDFDRRYIKNIQQVRSHQVELVALSDMLIGAMSYVFRGLNTSKAKLTLIEKIKERSGYSLQKSTLYGENKFNIFIWQSDYGKR